MTQRLTAQRQLFCALESTEGTEVFGGNNDVLSITNLRVAPDQAFYPRQFVGQVGTITGKIGAQTDPGLAFTVQARGGGTVTTPRLDNLYKVVLSPGQLDTPGGGFTTLGNGSSSTSLVVVSSTGFAVGNAVAVETTSGAGTFEVGWISSVPNGTTITLTHALTSSVLLTNGSKVLPSITYKPQNTNHGSLSFQMYLGTGNDRVSFVGCKGTMKLDVPAPGTAPYLTFLFRSMNWFNSNNNTKPGTPSYDTAVPPTPNLLKLDSTSFSVKLASWDLRQMVARKYSQNSTTGTASELVTDRNLMGLLQVYDVDTGVEFSNWTGGTEQAVAQQFGTTQFNMVAYQVLKAQRAQVAYGDDNGLTTDISVFEGNITNGADEIRLAFL